jgi:hypothetical protein
MLCKSIFYKIICKNIFIEKLQDVVKEKMMFHICWDFWRKARFYGKFVQIFYLIFWEILLIIRTKAAGNDISGINEEGLHFLWNKQSPVERRSG